MAYKITYILLFMLGLFTGNATAGLNGTASESPFQSSSVLKEGTWYKFKTSREGIHKITYEDLISAGIDPQIINPSTLQIFGNFNGMVAEKNKHPRQDDLLENSIFVAGEEDGSFDKQDYILFYSMPAFEWKINPFLRIYMHRLNLYDDHVYFFLRYNHAEGKRLGKVENASAEPTHYRNTHDYYTAHQKELYSLTKSGKEWYGEHIDNATPRTFSFEVPEVDQTSGATIRIRIAARTPVDCSLEIMHNEERLERIELEQVEFTSSLYATTYSRYIDFIPGSENVEIDLKLNPSDAQSQIWLDFLELNLKRKLVFSGEQFSFRDWSATGNANVTEFILADHTGKAKIWEVTDPFNVSLVNAEKINDSLRFRVTTDTLRHFIAWANDHVLKAEFVEKVTNQNLHALAPVDYVIVAHPLFMQEAHELASIHAQHNNLSSKVVSTEQIYNEFSGGKLDPGGIRDFVRMLYLKSGGTQPRYLLLFGDASYDPKNREGETHNFIPAYQSTQSINKIKSFVTDDFYGLMDEDEGEDAHGSLDIGVGRFPVSNAEQAQIVVSKIRHYMQHTKNVFGSWRNEVVFIADDEDWNAHFDQAEVLAGIVEKNHPQYHIKKIYLDAFPHEHLPGGTRIPQVNETIDEAVRQGSLFVNYTGHGGELGWADEKVLGIPTINNWDNLDRLPVFMTATCEFSRFDNPEFISGGELVLLNPKGGGIALFTTSRLSYSLSNYELNKEFYKNCFTPIHGEMPRLGDLVRLSKQSSNSGVLTKNFVLLGDPALQPAYPDHEVEVSDMIINGSTATITAKALSKVDIKGSIKDLSGNTNSNFNGLIYPMVYDKKIKYTTLGTDRTSQPATFNASTRLLYQNKASVKNGQFDFSFIVPRDIDYTYGEGTIHLYAVDTTSYTDANGSYNFFVGGVNENAEDDQTGPEISLYLNNPAFASGDVVDENPVLFINLQDNNGINSTGNGIGHDITLVVDGRTDESIILNNHYEPALDDFTQGSIVFPLHDLQPGLHSLRVKAWDMFNNSSLKQIDFRIAEDKSLHLQAVRNYPNPFVYKTTFEIDHQQLKEDTRVELFIFDTYGKLVDRMDAEVEPNSGSLTQLVWDGRDRSGRQLNSGVYVYHVIFSNQLGYTSKESGKLIIVH